MTLRTRAGLLLLGVAAPISVSPAQDPHATLIAPPMAPYSGPTPVSARTAETLRIDPLRERSTYGTSWGVASYGSRRLYSEFASPYGAGYGYGYKPTSFLPGPWGIEMWRPGQAAGTMYGSPHSYRTFPYPYPAGRVVYGPPLGVYAPAFGPGTSPIP